jgi:hypothetical protein
MLYPCTLLERITETTENPQSALSASKQGFELDTFGIKSEPLGYMQLARNTQNRGGIRLEFEPLFQGFQNSPLVPVTTPCGPLQVNRRFGGTC